MPNKTSLETLNAEIGKDIADARTAAAIEYGTLRKEIADAKDAVLDKLDRKFFTIIITMVSLIVTLIVGFAGIIVAIL